MADSNKEELVRRREALRQEVSTIREAIIDIEAPEGGQTQIDKLQNLKTFLAIRERELNDVEARLFQDLEAGSAVVDRRLGMAGLVIVPPTYAFQLDFDLGFAQTAFLQHFPRPGLRGQK